MSTLMHIFRYQILKKMKKILILLLFPVSLCAQQEILPPEIQIATAVLPLPEAERSTAMVYGYDPEGQLVVLRPSDKGMICIADDPTKEGIHVACYAVSLEPFMKRGRELLAAGHTESEKREIRKQEAESGVLKMPEKPAMTYVMTGSEEKYDRTTGALADGKLRYVIYIPYATTESTGLPASPHAPGMPWLMDPGTHRAHIMVTPPSGQQKAE